MQRILCLHLDHDSLRATLADVAEGEMRILSRSERPLSDSKLLDLSQIGAEEPSDEDEQDTENETNTQVNETKLWLGQEMKYLLEDIDGTWDSSIYVVPTPRTLTLHLDLPFSHPREVERILELEVQDKVPFVTEDFFLQPTSISPLNEGSFDIHVTLAPREYIDTIIGACRQADIDPKIVTTHEHISIGVFELFPELKEENTTVLIDSDDSLYTASYIAGEVRSARYIPLPSSNGTPLTHAQKKEKALRHLQRALISLEHRYDEEFETVVIFSDDEEFVMQAAQMLEPQVQHQQLAEIDATKDKSFLSALSLLLASPTAQSQPLCNFRSGPYAYRPQLKQIGNACKILAKPFLLLLMTSILCCILIYGAREYRISSLQGTLQEQVKKYIPGFSASEGQEINAIQTEYGTLNKQLKEIDAALRFSPLNTFIQLARIFREDEKIVVKKLRIFGNKIVIDGEAPNYDTVDKMKRKLKKKRSGFCRPNDKTSAGMRNKVNFTFTIQLCNT